MELFECAELETEGKTLVKNDTSDEAHLSNCDSFKEEETKRGNVKHKKGSFGEREEISRKNYSKGEDNSPGEVPAHHARRPPNGFLLFCKRHRDIVSAKNPNLENRGVTKLLGNWWRTLEEEEREKYKELARENKEIFIANNPQFTWYKLPAPPLRTLVTRPSNRRPPKLEPNLISTAGPITPGKLADESQLGGLTSLLCSSISPPSTPSNTSPPSPMPSANAPPKKRFLLQTRKKTSETSNSLSESDEPTDNNKITFKNAKKKYKKKKNLNSIKYKRNLKMKWNESVPGKMIAEGETHGWKSENGSPNCTQQQLIEKIVDSSFIPQKSLQDSEIQRKLDYIQTEHTYQKNASRCKVQQKPKINKKDDYEPLQIETKDENLGQNIISPNVNNNTIVLTETGSDIKKENGVNDISYSFNDNNNLIIDYKGVRNQRKLDQSNLKTNHDRISIINLEDGYIPGMYTQLLHKDCDNTKGLEDQKKPFQVAQDDDIPKNCDKDTNFQSILGEVSREIVNMINEQGPEGVGEMAVARFNVQSRSETDSDGSWGYKSDTSPPGSPGGRRPKRSCKGQRYEQFIKDSVSKKRGKTSEFYAPSNFRKSETKAKKRKLEIRNPSSDESEYITSFENELRDESKDIKINNDDMVASFKYEDIEKEKDKEVKLENENVNETEMETGNVNEMKKEIKNEDEKDKDKSKDECNGQDKDEDKGTAESNSTEQGADDLESSSQSSEDLNSKQGTKVSEIIQMKLNMDLKEKKEGDESVGRRQKELKNKFKKKPVSKVQMIKERREMHIGEFNLNEKIEQLPLLSFESFLQKKRQRKKRLLGLKKEGLKNKTAKIKFEKYKSRDPKSPLTTEVGSSVPIKSASEHPGNSVSSPDFADLATLAETALTLLSLGKPR